MVQNLGWEDLQYSRKQCKTAMMYRIVNNLIDIPTEEYLIHFGTSTRVHETRFLVPNCFVDAYKSSFFPSTIRLWNSLPVSQKQQRRLMPSRVAAVQSSKPDKMFLSRFIRYKKAFLHTCVHSFSQCDYANDWAQDFPGRCR